MQNMSQEDKLELAKSLDLSLEEFEDILKAADESDQDNSESEEPEKKEEVEEEKEDKEEMKKSLKNDIALKLKELHDLEKSEKLEEKIEKSNNDDLMKSFGEMKDELIKSIGEYKEEVNSLKTENDDLKKSIGEMKEVLEKIASNSQGTKGMRFNPNQIIEKSLDVEEKDGKKYYDQRDKDGLLKAMEGIMSSSTNEDLVKSVGDDIIQLSGAGYMTPGALRRLNENGIYLKNQEQ